MKKLKLSEITINRLKQQIQIKLRDTKEYKEIYKKTKENKNKDHLLENYKELYKDELVKYFCKKHKKQLLEFGINVEDYDIYANLCSYRKNTISEYSWIENQSEKILGEILLDVDAGKINEVEEIKNIIQNIR